MDSSSEEDSAVNDLLNQAKDQIILEQLAAINCSSFSDDSVLPSHLESRFSKLKSFPASKPTSSSAAAFNPNDQNVPILKSRSGSHPKPPEASPEKLETRLEPKQRHGSGSVSSNSSNASPDSTTFSPAKRVSGNKKKKEKEKKLLKSRSAKSGWLSNLSSPLRSCNSMREGESPSPPRKGGCFWCSPKSDKSKGNVGGIGLDLSDDDDLFSGLGSFSRREQRKIVKKAMKEEEKISREAEKIVKWATQQSARMNVNLTDDELSD